MKNSVFALYLAGILAFATMVACTAFSRSESTAREGIRFPDANGDGDSELNNIGNAIFIHPDGTGLNHFLLARHYWSSEGPDGVLEWDKLPQMAVYRGHMSDQLGATSNGGATAHAFGVKVQGPDSYGKDRGRAILSLSGYPGSFLREAGCYGHPIGIINDGDIAGEPGTGAFLAETNVRGEPNEQTRQLLEGRPGFEDRCDPGNPLVKHGDRLPDVILGGGEAFFLPANTPLCRDLPTPPDAGALPIDCAAHTDPVSGAGPAREDGRNLLELAAGPGYDYVIMRTREEFEKVKATVEANADYAPRLLGLFARDDIFNDQEEEELKEIGLLRNTADPLPAEGVKFGAEKIGNLVLWGTKYVEDGPNYSFNPPTIGEMTELGLEVLKRRAEKARRPFGVVIEVESTDNMPNKNNAIGTLRALLRTDEMIGAARKFLHENPETLIVTGADSDGSGPQLLSLRAVDAIEGEADQVAVFNPIHCENRFELDTCTVTATNVNPTGLEGGDQLVEVDGMDGRGGKPFLAEPDALMEHRPLANLANDTPSVPDQRLPFAVVWTGVPDVAGGILSRAEGLNASLLSSGKPFRQEEPPLYARFDNTDIYRMMYLTLFGKRLESGVGVPARDRPEF